MFRGYVSFTEGRHPRIDMKPEEMGLMSFKILRDISYPHSRGLYSIFHRGFELLPGN